MAEPNIKTSEEDKLDSRRLEFVKPQSAAKERRPPILRKLVALAVAVGTIAVLYKPAQTAVIEFLYYETTDDASIEGRLYPISSKVGGVVEQVMFNDNATVKKGDILVLLDKREYVIAVKQLQADLSAATAVYESAKADLDRGEFDDSAKRRRDELESQVALLRQAKSDLDRGEFDVVVKRARSDLEAQTVNLEESKKTLARIGELKKRNLISDEEFDLAKSTYENNLAKVDSLKVQLKEADLSSKRAKDAAEAKVQNLESVIRANEMQIREALRDSGSAADNALKNYKTALARVWSLQAQLDQAKLNLEYTEVRAPADGQVSKRSVEPGMIIKPNQILTLLLGSGERWVVANYKETQLNHIYIGQPAEIEIDAIEGRVFQGTVESISPGSGSTFALIAPDNATGNFTKIVQRVPVKINFIPESIKGFENRLVPGISVFCKLRIKAGPSG